MKKKIFKLQKRKLVLQAAALSMCLCLMLVTGMNFIIYAESNQSELARQTICTGNAAENMPEKPVEEKSAVGMNIIEEIMHEISYLPSDFLFKGIASYFIPHTVALCMVHYDLLSPPPNLA